MASAEHTDRFAMCARCGYDLRGSIATWAESCPLDGVCPECGLEFAWADVLRADRNGPRWSIEYDRDARWVPHAAAKTFLVSFLPWKFWGDLQMHHEVRPRRLRMYALLIVTLLLLTYVAVQGAGAVWMRWELDQDALRTSPAAINAQLAMLQTLKTQIEQNTHPNFLNSSEAERTAVAQSLQDSIALYRFALTNPARVDHSYAAAVVEAIVRPLGETSKGTTFDPIVSRTYSYPGPRYIWPTLARTTPLSDDVVAGFLIGTTAGVIGLVILPVSLVLLPFTRRRCRIRWSHILRVSVYSLWITFVATLCAVIAVAAATQYWVSDSTAIAFMVALPWVLLIIWWSAAARRYLRMPHPEFTILLHAIMCALAIPAVPLAIRSMT